MATQFRKPRLKANFQVQISGPHDKQVVEIVDVNEYGARLKTTNALKRGDIINFSVLYASLTARVLWASDSEAGVAFRPILNARTLGMIRQGAAKVTAPRFDSRSLQEMR